MSELKMVFKVKFLVLGGHVHFDIFTAPMINGVETTFSKCTNAPVIMRIKEFDLFRNCCSGSKEGKFLFVEGSA